MPDSKPAGPAVRIVVRTLGAAIALFLLLFGWRVASYYRAISRGDIAALPQFTSRLTRSVRDAPGSPLAIDVTRGNHPTLGNAHAPLTVVLFADFECPYSKEAFLAARSLLSLDPRVRFIFRNFPLEEIHPNARSAAAAAHCAEAQGKFWPFHDKLFQNAPNLSPPDLRFYAEQIGLDRSRFESCLIDPTTQAAVAADYADGVAAGVRGTPTFFFNGKKVEGAIPATILKQLIEGFTKT